MTYRKYSWVVVVHVLWTLLEMSAQTTAFPHKTGNEIWRKTDDTTVLENLSHVERSKPVSSAATKTSLGAKHRDLYAALENMGAQQVTSKATRYLMKVYQRLTRGLDFSRATGAGNRDPAVAMADTLRSFNSKAQHQAIQSKWFDMDFPVSALAPSELMTQAQLRVRGSVLSAERHKLKFKATLITDGVVLTTRKYKIRRQFGAPEGYMTVDVTRLLRELPLLAFRNQTVRISLRSGGIAAKHKSAAAGNGKLIGDSMLLIFSKDPAFFEKAKQFSKTTEQTTQIQRTKRARSFKRPRKECAKYDLTVDFDAIGWGRWIVYPRRFNAYQCRGRCPMPAPQKYEPTNHAIFQSLMRLKDKNLALRPCCVPIELSPISMLYYEQDEIVVRQHDNMAVDRCGCR